MPTPSSSLSTILRPDLAGALEEFDLVNDRAGFIGNRVLPPLDVNLASGKFGRIPIEQLLRSADTTRAPRSGYARGDWQFETDTYTTQEYGAEEPVDENEANTFGQYIDAELTSTALAVDLVLREREKRVAAAVFNATTFASSTTAVTNEWDDAMNATPIADIKAAKQAMWEAAAIKPDALILNHLVFENLRHVHEILDRIKYQGFVNVVPSAINESILASVLNVREIIVAGSPKNSAAMGSLDIDPIWSGEYAMLAKIARTSSIKEVCLGRTFHWSGDGSQINCAVETYPDPVVRSNIIRARQQVGEKIIYVPCGYLLSNITT